MRSELTKIILENMPPPSFSREDLIAEYEKYKADSNYTDVEMNDAGGLKATHKLHSFDKIKGHCEKEARDILFKEGHKIILEKELPRKGEKVILNKRFVDGTLNDDSYEQGTIIGESVNTIIRALRHAEYKKADVAVIYFPDMRLFSEERMREVKARFNGVKKRDFKKIICVLNGEVKEIK